MDNMRWIFVWFVFTAAVSMVKPNKMAQFVQTGYTQDKWTTTHKYNVVPYQLSSLAECAMTCSNAGAYCVRFEFYQRQHGAPGQCTLHKSGTNCVDDGTLDLPHHYCYKLQFKKNEDDTCNCAVGFYGNGNQCCEFVIEDCKEGNSLDHLKDQGPMMSAIKPRLYTGEPFQVLCLFGYGGLTYIQTRQDKGMVIDFNRTWEEYKTGFGNVESSHWLGLDKVLSLLNSFSGYTFQLDIAFENEHQTFCQLHAQNFKMLGEADNYTVKFDALGGHGWCHGLLINPTELNPNEKPFATYDHNSNSYNCPLSTASGWWFANHVDCSNGNINGPYDNTTQMIAVHNQNTVYHILRASMLLSRH